MEIGQKIDGNSTVKITTDGPIHIGQKIDGNSVARPIAGNPITIDQKVDGHSKVYWTAPSFNCPEIGGGSIVEEVLPEYGSVKRARPELFDMPTRSEALGEAVSKFFHQK